MKITIAGTGYVGLSLATLLSQKNTVYAFDISPEKVDKINNRISPIRDNYIEDYFKSKKLDLLATVDPQIAFADADFVVISTPTDYDDKTNTFNTTSVESVIESALNYNPKATIVIKSTIPVGYTEKIKKKFNYKNIFFSPEFLREGRALYDNLYPSRIIIGGKTKEAKQFGEILSSCALNHPNVLHMSPTEAEAVKLFANTFLALRISFFNELDTYAEMKGLDARNLIKGISLDPRIGDYYNNPSFGYGGYCLPKDTKQLLSNFNNVPQDIIGAVIESNKTRKKYITNTILKNKPKVVGIYRLTMKAESDNFRSSAILDIIKELEQIKNISIIIYEPTLINDSSFGHTIDNNLDSFAKRSDIILANRISDELLPFIEKVYTRDIFKQD